jgi:hypothetical protein
MLRKKILNIILSMSLLLGITSCISNTEVIDGKSYHLAVSVNDSGFAPTPGIKATTRATESGYVTTFAKGDQIGLFVVNSSNTVETTNLCLTYDGTNWNYPTGKTLYYDNTANKRYFAYYPYQGTLTGAPTTSSATDAATFFATAISDWTPATDQSSQAKYTASDLMVGTGTAGTLYSNATRTMSFSMSHQMALVDMNFPYYYLSTDNNYTYTLGLTCNGFKPYHLSKGNYRYIIKSATSTSIWGYYCTTTSANTNQIFNKAFTIAAGTYQTMNVDNTSTSTSYTMSIGDYYLNDGSVIPNATTNKYLLSKAIGVVFDTSTSTTDQGYGWAHGYVMALTNETTTCAWGQYGTTENGIDVLSDGTVNYTYQWFSGEIYTSFITDKDGYCETHAISSTHFSTLKNNYPAFYHALNYGINNTNYAAPNGSSNWYLPSIGQWWDILTNLGKMSTVYSSKTGSCYWYNGSNGNNGSAYLCANKINSFLSAISGYITCDFFYTNSSNNYEYYWSSSEYDGSNAGFVTFANDGGLYLNSYNKGGTNRVRSVLAF